MALLIHILIALSSIAAVVWLYVAPTHAKFHVAYSLIFLTIASGSFLIVLTPSRMAHVCIAGLVYISLALIGTVCARYKFAPQKI